VERSRLIEGGREMANVDVELNPYLNPRSIPYRLRQRRYHHIGALIDTILGRHGRCRIIDIGGVESYWNIANGQIDDPRIDIVLVNLHDEPVTKANFKSITADARDMHEFADMSFDLVHSNSVLEHVGGWGDMERFAVNVRRLAPTYFVQSPYFGFPIEPHFRSPMFHWLPEPVQYRLIMSRNTDHIKRAASVADAVRAVQSAKLLDRRQYTALFPDAEIKSERVFGLTKSLMATRTASGA
jgi:hypothetical protein